MVETNNLNFFLFQNLIFTMVSFKSQNILKFPATSSYQTCLLKDLKAATLSSLDDVVLVSSGEERVYVHTVLLIKASKLINSWLGELCICQSNTTIILPHSPPATLDSLLTLLYTGVVSNISSDHGSQVLELAKQMGLDIRMERVENDVINKTDQKDTHIGCTQDDIEKQDTFLNEQTFGLRSTLLKTEAVVIEEKRGVNVDFSFPKSRIKREASRNITYVRLSGFEGRVQKEYNSHPVHGPL